MLFLKKVRATWEQKLFMQVKQDILLKNYAIIQKLILKVG